MAIRKTAKKIFKFIGILTLSIVAFLVLYFTAAFCFSRIAVERESQSTNEVTIYIKTNGVHTDLVVPVKTELIDWSKEIRFSHTQLSDTNMQFLGMGWGDKGFYLETPNWSDLKASVAFNAAFALSTTAIHATYYNTLIENDSCRKILISKSQYARLIAYISESFQKNNAGHMMVIKTNANYGKADAFYEANGKYNLFRTCNTWANNGLKSCGQRACLWTIFDTGIFLKYKK